VIFPRAHQRAASADMNRPQAGLAVVDELADCRQPGDRLRMRVAGSGGLRPELPGGSAGGLRELAVLARRRAGGTLEGAGEREFRVVADLMGDLADGGVAVA
jgi:hypothetical protein